MEVGNERKYTPMSNFDSFHLREGGEVHIMRYEGFEVENPIAIMPQQKLIPEEHNVQEKALYTSYVLGKAMLKSLEIAVHEMKTSNTKEDSKRLKNSLKARLKLAQGFKETFPNPEVHLTKEEKENLDMAIYELVGGLW